MAFSALIGRGSAKESNNKSKANTVGVIDVKRRGSKVASSSLHGQVTHVEVVAVEVARTR